MDEDNRFRNSCMGYFGTSLSRPATHIRIISAVLLTILPCVALPPGVVYSSVLANSFPPGPDTSPPPLVSLVTSDASGNSYVAGAIYSNGLASTPGVFQPTYSGGTCHFGVGPGAPPQLCPDAFVAKFDPSGALLFLTYLGGTGNDTPRSLAVDASGNIYLAGQTNSLDFPLAGSPWRPVISDEGGFVAKISGDGKRLIWSTVLNGDLQQLVLAGDGSLYCFTQTSSSDNLGTSYTETLTKLTGDGLFAATFIAPSGTRVLAAGADGSVYIGGLTDGTDVTPTPGAWQTSLGGSLDGFVAKMNGAFSGFDWLTYFGGNDNDFVNYIQPAPDGSLWVTGSTYSSNFPVLAGAWQTQPTSGADFSGYLVHLSADGSKALAATYLPGVPQTLALDPAGDVIVSVVSQNDFQATPGTPWPCRQSGPLRAAGFIGKIDSAAQHLLWGTWTGPSVPFGPVTVDISGNAVAAGTDTHGDVIISALTTVPGPPRLVDTCILPAGYPYVPGLLAPGEVISIYGAGFGPQQGIVAQPSANTFGTELGGVQVFIENVAAPLLYVSSNQINLVTPYMLNGRIAAHIKIVTASATSNEVVLGVQQTAPEIFVSGVFQNYPTAAIINQDGTLNSPDHPAHVGDFVSMWVSGVGQTNPAAVDGAIPDAAGGTPLLPIQVQLVTTPPFPYANVTYSGNAPGLVSGVTQVNFQMPFVNSVGAGPPYVAWVVLFAGATASGPDDGPVIWFE